MRHKRIIAISIAALMLVSLCALCASTSVAAAQNSTGAPPNGLDSGTAVCSWGANRLDVFAKGTNGNLWHKWWDGSWHNWEDLGSCPGGLYSAPAAVSWGYGRIDVFWQGVSGDLVHKWFDAANGGWHGYETLGAPNGGLFSLSAPTVSSWGPGRLDVFVGGLGQLWQKWFDVKAPNPGWQAWLPLGEPSARVGGSPGAISTTSWGYNRIDVFIRGADDGALWQLWWVPNGAIPGVSGGWQPWHRFDNTALNVQLNPYDIEKSWYYGTYDYAPAVCSMSSNRLDVFFVDSNFHLQQLWWDGSWHLNPVGGDQLINAAPSAVAWQLGGTTRLDIFARTTPLGWYILGTEFALWQYYWASDGSGWHGWYYLRLLY